MPEPHPIDRIAVLRQAERLIREAVGDIVRDDAMLPVEEYRHHGVFVTIYIDSRLRGCIGCLDESMAFADALRYAATRAATADYRFAPIQPSELRDLQCEVTILEHMERIRGAEDIRIGTHGVMIESRTRRGLLLPQVASERGWDADRFLSAVCEKAGLPPSAIDDPETVLMRFAATRIAASTVVGP